MSFQAYIDNIKAKTGKTPEDFKSLAEAKGLLQPGVKAAEIVAWLKEEFDLGHGHAMAIYAVFKGSKEPQTKGDGAVDKHFSGKKASWRAVFDQLLQQLQAMDAGVRVDPTSSYLSLLKNDKKFAIVQVTAERFDIGIKRKDAEPGERFEAAGAWNAMVTHRVRITDAAQIDTELLDWLKQAMEKAN